MGLLQFQSAFAFQSTKCTTEQYALEISKTQIGVKETGYNRGGKVSEYIKRGGGKDGWAWCMYFVYWCFDEASKIVKTKNPLKRTGSCSEQLRYANSWLSGLRVIKPNQLINSEAVPKGSVVIFKSGTIFQDDIGKNWNGHTGITEKQINNTTFQLIEGNTNALGSREGNAVARKIRNTRNKRLNVIGIIVV